MKHRLVGLCVSALSLVCAFLGLEVFLRATGLQTDFFVQLDQDVGATYIPHKTGWYVYPDGRTWAEINGEGYLDHEWVRRKPRGLKRLALLGDSYIAGMEVPVGRRASEVMSNLLNRDCRRPYEILNFGVIGYGTAQEFETLRHKVLPFAPDEVLLFFYTGNDLFNNDRELDVEPNRVHFTLGASGQLVPLPFTVRDSELKRWLRHHSKAFLFIRDGIARFTALHEAAIKAGLMQDATTSKRGGAPTDELRGAQYRQPVPPAIERSWEITEALIVATAKHAADHGMGFGLVLIPTKEEILDGMITDVRLDTNTDMDMQMPTRRIEQICRAHGLDCFNVGPAFAQHSVSEIEDAFGKRGGHWTASGHEIAGHAIAEWLRGRECGNGDLLEAGAGESASKEGVAGGGREEPLTDVSSDAAASAAPDP